MNVEKLEKLPPPPGVIGSLRAGFDVVSSHVWLILVPVVLDVVLWLGPRLSAGNLMSRVIAGLIGIMDETRPFPPQDINSLTVFAENSSRFNWLSWIRTFPVGASSLEAYSYPVDFPLQTPLGLQSVVQIGSVVNLLGWTFLLTIAGWIVGGLYFRWVSVTTLGEEEAGISPMRAIAQTFLLSLGWSLGGFIVMIPLLFVLVLLTMISPLLSNTIVIVILILSYWLIVPLFFMPHGIFARKQNALFSVLSSLRMSRFTLPTSGMFVFSVFLLARGLSYLWSVPKNDSWMTLVGISGHAFITTALLAASLVYYRDMNVWIQHALEKLQQKQSTPTQQA
jgi:hypothetical protein